MTALLNTASSFSVSSLITIVVAVLIAIGAIAGLARGLGRQIVRTATVGASVFIALLLTNNISESFNSSLEGKTVEDLLSFMPTSTWPQAMKELIMGIEAETARTVLSVPVAVVLLPLIFLVSFILISAVGEIVHIIISALLRLKMSRNNPATRFLGFVLGAVQGALVAGLFLFPVGCYANLAEGMLTSMSDGGIKEDSNVERIYEVMDTYLDEAGDNPILNIVMSTVGNKLQDKFATVTIDGEKTDGKEHLYTLIGVVGDYSYLEGCNFKAPTEAERAVINGIKDKCVNDEYMADVISGILRETALAVKEGRLEISVGEPYGGMLREAISLFETSDAENLGGDMTTFLDVYHQLADAGTLTEMTENPGGVIDTLIAKPNGNKTVITGVVNTLNGYERTKPLVSMISKFSISIMADQLGISEDVIAIYDNVKAALADVASIDKNLTNEEYSAAVGAVITDAFTSNGINLEADVINGMSDYVTDNFKTSDVLDDADIDSIILSYYDAYLGSLGD